MRLPRIFLRYDLADKAGQNAASVLARISADAGRLSGCVQLRTERQSGPRAFAAARSEFCSSALSFWLPPGRRPGLAHGWCQDRQPLRHVLQPALAAGQSHRRNTLNPSRPTPFRSPRGKACPCAASPSRAFPPIGSQPLAGHLAQAEGAPLTAENLKGSLRQLYATGLYDTIEVRGTRQGDGVALVFRGTPRTFIGTVGVDGATGATMNTQLERASQLDAGTRLTQAKMIRAVEQMRATLEQNGYHEAAITQTVTPHARAAACRYRRFAWSRVRGRASGKVTVTGDSGMTLEEFRHACALCETGATSTTIPSIAPSMACSRNYQNQNRLEADVKLESAQSTTDRQGDRLSIHRQSRARWSRWWWRAQASTPSASSALSRSFEEGSVDEDLLNEGNRRLRDYYQRLGYFDAKVDHQRAIRRTAERSDHSSTPCNWACGAALKRSPSQATTTLTRPRSWI